MNYFAILKVRTIRSCMTVCGAPVSVRQFQRTAAQNSHCPLLSIFVTALWTSTRYIKRPRTRSRPGCDSASSIESSSRASMLGAEAISKLHKTAGVTAGPKKATLLASVAFLRDALPSELIETDPLDYRSACCPSLPRMSGGCFGGLFPPHTAPTLFRHTDMNSVGGPA